MNNVLTAEMPRGKRNLNIFKKVMIKKLGLQGYIDSYEQHLRKQWLVEYEVQQELNRMRWQTIHEMQKNYQYN